MYPFKPSNWSPCTYPLSHGPFSSVQVKHQMSFVSKPNSLCTMMEVVSSSWGRSNVQVVAGVWRSLDHCIPVWRSNISTVVVDPFDLTTFFHHPKINTLLNFRDGRIVARCNNSRKGGIRKRRIEGLAKQLV